MAKDLERSGQVVTLAGDIIRTKALDLLVERADIEIDETQTPKTRRPEDAEKPEKDAKEEANP